MSARRAFSILLVALPALAHADDEASRFSVHVQATYVAQEKPAFDAAYTGPNSLIPQHESSYSFSGTLYLGARLWSGAEGYANVEGVQGAPFSNMTGLGGFTNGELAKTAGRTLTVYRARLYLKQTFGYGGGDEKVEDDKNQVATTVDRRRLAIYAGNLSVVDLFDANRYAHDARGDFSNIAVIESGAYDYAADSRGYTWGLAAEWHDLAWTLRAGRFAEPKEPNGLALDSNIGSHFGDQVELEIPLQWHGHEGRLRLLGFHSAAVMGRYRDALALAQAQGGTPQLAAVRRPNHKYGAALNVEQEVADGVGTFLRASWNDGQTETYSFTEIDGSVAAGLVLEGRHWRRPHDEAGFAVVQDDLSHAHRDYLAAGGLGFFLGDGRLTYRPERIVEGYYSIGLAKQLFVTLGAQRIRNPGYNADRGPAGFYGVRVHAEF